MILLLKGAMYEVSFFNIISTIIHVYILGGLTSSLLTYKRNTFKINIQDEFKRRRNLGRPLTQNNNNSGGRKVKHQVCIRLFDTYSIAQRYIAILECIAL